MKIASKWIEEAANMAPEEELYIPVSSRNDQKNLIKALRKAKDRYSQVAPVEASQLLISPFFHKGRLWVKIKKTASTGPLIGFKKRRDGKLEKVALTSNSEIERTIFLMKKDGLSKQEIIETLQLTEEDMKVLKQKGAL